MSENPYEAPASAVQDPTLTDASGDGFTGEIHVRDSGAGMRWLSEAWRLFMLNPGLWIAMIFIIFAICVAVQILGPFGGLAQTLLTPIFGAGVMLGCERVHRGGVLKLDDLFAAFKEPYLVPMLILGAIYLVAAIVVVVISIIPMMGTIFLIIENDDFGSLELIPILLGMSIFALLWLPLAAASWMAGPLIVINRVPPLEAMKLSLIGCFKNWLPFLIYSLVLLPLAIAATIPLMLGWVVLAPVVMASFYTCYRDIYYRDGGLSA